MPDYTFDPGLVIDDATSTPVPNAVGYLRETMNGPNVPVYDMQGTPISELRSNDRGYVARFSADIPRGYVFFGEVVQSVASDQVQDSLARALAAESSAEAAVADARDALTKAQEAVLAAEAALASVKEPSDAAVDAGIDRAAANKTSTLHTTFLRGTLTGVADGYVPKWSAAEDKFVPGTLPTPTGSHGALSGRDAADQHPMSAISGLEDALGAKSDADHIHVHQHDLKYATIDHTHEGGSVELPPLVRKIRTSDGAVVNNSQALVADSVLNFPIAANESWDVEVILHYEADTAADARFSVTGPSGATCYGSVNGFGAGTSAYTTGNKMEPIDMVNSTGQQIGALGIGTRMVARLGFTVTAGSTAGTVGISFAQWNSHASNARVLTGSMLIATKGA